MNSAKAANISLVLAVLALPLLGFGFLSRMEDPAPWVSAQEVIAAERIALAALSLGLAGLVSSFTFAIKSFAAARKRAIVALMICALPFCVLLALVLN